jgi:hypothetical protein
MSYMARMGGWSVLDYGLRYADDPYDWIRLGYASYLDPFGLVNAGDEESDYGYWYPGKEKDGAMGQAFTPTKFGRAWIGTEEGRGPWRYCGEGDLGMCAITRTAATILVRDPLFGWTLYGGNLAEEKGAFCFIPEDGVSRSLYLVTDDRRVGISVDRGHWSAESPVRVLRDQSRMTVPVETGGKSVTLTIDPLRKMQTPVVRAGGKRLQPRKDRYGRWLYTLPEGDSVTVEVLFSGIGRSRALPAL